MVASFWERFYACCCYACDKGNKGEEYEVLPGTDYSHRPLIAPTQQHLAVLNSFLQKWVETNNTALLTLINKSLEDLQLDLALEIRGLHLNKSTLDRFSVQVDTLTPEETVFLMDVRVTIKDIDIKKDYIPEVTVESLILDGVARITMMASAESPISEIRLSFISKPKFDFGMNMFLEVTGIQDVIEAVIESQIAGKMVQPNYVTVYSSGRQDTKERIRTELSSVVSAVYSAGSNYKKPDG